MSIPIPVETVHEPTLWCCSCRTWMLVTYVKATATYDFLCPTCGYTGVLS